MDFKQQIVEQLASLTELDIEKVAGAVEVPPNPEMGDLAFPCFPLAKIMRKAPPVIAAELKEKFPKSDYVEKIEVAGGYLNFYFSRSFFVKEQLGKVFSEGADYGKTNEGNGKTVLVEFSSPNIAKPFHIGHLFSTALGNSLEKIYSFLGYETVKINHLGDWGTQFGKLISAYKRWGDPEVIEKDPINELLKLYVHFHEVAKENPELDDEAREYFRLLEAGDEETVNLWKYFREVSIVEFKRVYDMLNISFDSYNGESFYSDKMDEVVEILKSKNLLVESEGAMVVDLSEEDMPPCMILKSNGTTIYATRDIAAALYRHRTYNFHKNIYVVGMPQALHFKQIFSVVEKMCGEWAKSCAHVGFGLVKFPDKKLSTRDGDIVFLEDVLKESVSKTLGIMTSGTSELDNPEEVAQKVGIGAILYAFLKNNREKDIIFSWDTMLDFEGESGPYVQYSYARGRSILRRSGTDYSDADYSLLTTDEEYELIKHIAKYSEAVSSAADKDEPFYVNRYVTTLAKLFNKFYNTNPILKSDVDPEIQKARLALVEATTIVIKSALSLLGIETVEKM